MTHRRVLVKLLWLVGISVVAFAGMGVYGVSNTSSTFTWVKDVYRTAEDFRKGSQQITNPLNELRQLSMSIVMAPNAKLQEEFNRKQESLTLQMDRTLGEWNAESDEASERQAFQQLRVEWEQYKQLKDATIAKALDRYREEAFINATGAEREQFQRVNGQLTLWMRAKIDSADKVYQDANAQYEGVFRVSSLVIVLVTLVAGSIGYLTTRGIVRPIEALKDAASRIASRETVTTIDVRSNDELGDLARSMEAMAGAIQSYMAQQLAAEAEVRQLNASLERRVEERTAELEKAIAELRAAKEAAEEANRRLIEAERVKSEFFANVSHELRTPLTLILAPLESVLAGEYGAIPEECRRILETMHNNAVRLLQMVTGLLDFSKLEARKVEVKREPVSIAALTRAILADFEPLLSQTGLTGSLETGPDEACVSMDRYLYERILFNLLSNALKFTPQGGKVSISLRFTGGRLRLAVADTGIGIAEADLANLFQKFRQLEGAATRRFEGTGLGLALVREFAGLLGGRVSVASKVGEGSTFTVECLAPLAEAPVLETAPLRPKKSLLRKYSSGSFTPGQADEEGSDTQPKVVIAEDNVELASYISSLLRELCQVRVARDGEEALELIRQWGPDAVLSDVMMPKRDGLSLCKELKSAKETAAIPVVLLTALTHREALLKGWEAGADEYLFKPFHPRELVTRITSILSGVQDRKRWEKELAARAAELARSNAELEQFAYVASHDLQEPLRKIQTFGEMLGAACGPALSEEGRDYIQRMRNAARRMQLLINDLLSLSRLTSQAKPFVEADLGRIAAETLSDLEARILETGGNVEIGELPRIEADPMQLRQLLQNLIGNALKFHRPKDPPIVRVQGRILTNSASAPGKAALPSALCEITVQDNGIGFDEKYLQRIFAPFQRLHGREEYEGTGMGLAICHKIVERHGGTITARSASGQGATFIVVLPLRQPKGQLPHE